MRPSTEGPKGAKTDRKSDGGHPRFSDSSPHLQGPTAPLPLRSRGLVFHVTPASLDRLADFELQLGHVAAAERLAHRAAEMRREVSP